MRLHLLRTVDPLVSLLHREFDILILTIEPSLATLTEISYIYDLLTEFRIYNTPSATLINNSTLIRTIEISEELGNIIKKDILKLCVKLPDLAKYKFQETTKRSSGKLSDDMIEFSLARYKQYLTNYSIKQGSRDQLPLLDIQTLEIPELQDLIRMLEISNKHYSSLFLQSMLSKATKLRESP